MPICSSSNSAEFHFHLLPSEGSRTLLAVQYFKLEKEMISDPVVSTPCGWTQRSRELRTEQFKKFARLLPIISSYVWKLDVFPQV